ncbi:MAG: hypothetical protein ACJA1E_001463 [Paracoccaceae bacterium]|jgi:hypothetical protein
MLFRLVVALLLILGVFMWAVGEEPGKSRIELAAERIAQQRATPSATAPVEVRQAPERVLPASAAVAASQQEPQGTVAEIAPQVAAPTPTPAPEPVAEVPLDPDAQGTGPIEQAVAAALAPQETGGEETGREDVGLATDREPVVAEIQTSQAGIDTVILLYVTGGRVNLRSGPSTNDAVVGVAARGDAVELLDFEAEGWARVRVLSQQIEAFMSSDFLSDTP